MMKFSIDFEHPDTGEHRNITIDLEPDEIAKARATDDPNLFAMTYALRRAYAELPRGFHHVALPELLRPN